jgi:hypothetical protein
MTRGAFKKFCIGWILLAGVLLLARADSEQPETPAGPDGPPPLPPGMKSPVTFFRGLLTMTDAERERALTNRSPEVRERLLAKVREYQSLPPMPREFRLRMTELRFYLVPLMQAAPARRSSLVTNVPPHLRKLVTDRLEQWNLLPPEMQRELLANELALDYFTQAPGPATPQEPLPGNLTPTQWQVVGADIKRWEAMSAGERRKLFERVKNFFDLPPEEQEKALNTLPRTEREQMEKTLDAFQKLPPGERAQCLRAFTEFVGMSAVERQRFLQSAERWNALSSGERQTWRDLVRKLPEMPPLPPDFYDLQPPPLPPMSEPPAPAVTTNGS